MTAREPPTTSGGTLLPSLAAWWSSIAVSPAGWRRWPGRAPACGAGACRPSGNRSLILPVIDRRFGASTTNGRCAASSRTPTGARPGSQRRTARARCRPIASSAGSTAARSSTGAFVVRRTRPGGRDCLEEPLRGAADRVESLGYPYRPVRQGPLP
eukprot:5509305-Pyramimonas_sp.AAC.1